MLFRAERVDITTMGVGAIVNAANAELRGGGGVDGAIHRAAGPELLAACARIGGCRPGDAVATPGFALAAAHVIHTVGPVWSGGDRGEDDTLASCYRRVLEVADELGAATIAIPAISTGVYGFPRPRAARLAVATLRATATAVTECTLVAFDAETLALYQAELAP